MSEVELALAFLAGVSKGGPILGRRKCGTRWGSA